jgi:lon-related putative ATP-dependent protease
MTASKPLSPEKLFTPCDPGQFTFETTDQLETLDDFVGQKRAVEAVKFAIGIDREGYNLFAFGPEGTGKSSLVRRFLGRRAAEQPIPEDWVYIYNFGEPHRPRALRLPPGRARALADDMDHLVEDLLAAIPAAFESDEYRSRRQTIEEQFKESHEESLAALQERAAKKNVAVIRTPMGLAVAPVRDGEVIQSEDFQKLPDEEREQFKNAMEEIQDELQNTLQQIPRWEKDHRTMVKQLDDEVTESVVSQLIVEFQQKYPEFPEIQSYLEEVKSDVIKNVRDFLPTAEGDGPQAMLTRMIPRGHGGSPPLNRFKVNVIIDNCEAAGDEDAATKDEAIAHARQLGLSGAPVIEEELPTQPNLIGRIEHLVQQGALITDFTMIRPGALHRANGGYLILDARKLLTQPFAYDTLKRALTTGKIRFENPADNYGIVSTVSLDPEPIPLKIKVVLIGEAEIYYLLSRHDPEFGQLFKVAADFDNRMERDDANAHLYARMIGTLGRREKLKPLDKKAVARVVEYGARLAEDSQKLSTHMGSVVDLVREADYWAAVAGAKVVGRNHVQKAIDAKIYRSDRIRERIQEEIQRGTIVIDSDGGRVGEVNGLAVYQLDHFSFGKPSRISARVHLGRGEVIDIEREVELGGALHSKGVLILSSYLNGRFAGEMPLALAASLVFEQSYGGVDGDSASSAELYALLSAIAEVPLKQSFAVTGSVDQNGRVQAIGGVNEKIEGFFDICAARGLNGEQGVLIPAANAKHLMLRDDVVAAARDGRFHVYSVETIDQGVSILTGMDAGEPDDKGEFPIGTFNRMVHARLQTTMRRAQAFAARMAPPQRREDDRR